MANRALINASKEVLVPKHLGPTYSPLSPVLACIMAAFMLTEMALRSQSEEEGERCPESTLKADEPLHAAACPRKPSIPHDAPTDGMAGNVKRRRYRTKAAVEEEKAGAAPTAAELQKAAAEEEKAGAAPTAEEEKAMTDDETLEKWWKEMEEAFEEEDDQTAAQGSSSKAASAGAKQIAAPAISPKKKAASPKASPKKAAPPEASPKKKAEASPKKKAASPKASPTPKEHTSSPKASPKKRAASPKASPNKAASPKASPKKQAASPKASPKKKAASQKASPKQKAAGKASPKAASSPDSSSPRGRGGDRQRRATRGSVGTFAGRLPPKGAEKKAIFNAIRQEYYDSKEWAKEQNFVWKESIDGGFSVQLCWKTMKEIMNGAPADFEQKREMAKNAWRHIVRENFGEVADA